MQITGITLSQFTRWADAVSRELYGGNVVVSPDAHDSTPYKNGTPRCTARLAVRDSRGPGSRTAVSGRHGPYACWHAYRDVLSELFRHHPDAVIRSGNNWRVTYRGRSGFLASYPATGRRPVGSLTDPVTMPELCGCDGSEPPRQQRYEFPMTEMTRPAAHVEHPDTMIRALARRLEYDDLLSSAAADALRRDLASRLEMYEGRPYRPFAAVRDQAGVRRTARDAEEFTLVRTTQPPEPAPFVNPFSDAGYVSPAVERAARVTAASAELLGEKLLDPYVFGREHEDSPPHGYY